MARFQALIETDRAKRTSRLANKWGTVQLNTWDRGILVEAQYNPTNKQIIFSVWETGGSNHPRPKKLLARMEVEKG